MKDTDKIEIGQRVQVLSTMLLQTSAAFLLDRDKEGLKLLKTVSIDVTALRVFAEQKAGPIKLPKIDKRRASDEPLVRHQARRHQGAGEGEALSTCMRRARRARGALERRLHQHVQSGRQGPASVASPSGSGARHRRLEGSSRRRARRHARRHHRPGRPTCRGWWTRPKKGRAEALRWLIALSRPRAG